MSITYSTMPGSRQPKIYPPAAKTASNIAHRAVAQYPDLSANNAQVSQCSNAIRTRVLTAIVKASNPHLERPGECPLNDNYNRHKGPCPIKQQNPRKHFRLGITVNNIFALLQCFSLRATRLVGKKCCSYWLRGCSSASTTVMTARIAVRVKGPSSTIGVQNVTTCYSSDSDGDQEGGDHQTARRF